MACLLLVVLASMCVLLRSRQPCLLDLSTLDESNGIGYVRRKEEELFEIGMRGCAWFANLDASLRQPAPRAPLLFKAMPVPAGGHPFLFVPKTRPPGPMWGRHPPPRAGAMPIATAEPIATSSTDSPNWLPLWPKAGPGVHSWVHDAPVQKAAMPIEVPHVATPSAVQFTIRSSSSSSTFAKRGHQERQESESDAEMFAELAAEDKKQPAPRFKKAAGARPNKEMVARQREGTYHEKALQQNTKLRKPLGRRQAKAGQVDEEAAGAAERYNNALAYLNACDPCFRELAEDAGLDAGAIRAWGSKLGAVSTSDVD